MSHAAAPPRSSRAFLGALLVLTAANLRPLFTSLSAVLPDVTRDLRATPLAAGLLTTIPVLCLGLFAPLAPAVARRVGMERALAGVVLLLALGTGLRGRPDFAVVMAGTVLAGAAIAMGNVLLPGLVKRDFPDNVPLMTGLYSAAIGGGAALAASLTVPIERAADGKWNVALAAWAIPALIVFCAWLPLLRRPSPPGLGRPAAGLWASPLAWQVTIFMGLQSALAYSIFGWLAPILRERGLEATTAGYYVGLSVVGQTVTMLVAPWLATRGRDQRLTCAVLLGCAVGGFLGALTLPLPLLLPAVVVQGVGQGGLLAVIMTIIILRSSDAATAARLSGMAQGVGYVMAAAAPFVIGLIREATGSFAATGGLVVALGFGAFLASLGAGRDRVLPSPGERAVTPAGAPSP